MVHGHFFEDVLCDLAASGHIVENDIAWEQDFQAPVASWLREPHRAEWAYTMVLPPYLSGILGVAS